jgi:hypothetical protein
VVRFERSIDGRRVKGEKVHRPPFSGPSHYPLMQACTLSARGEDLIAVTTTDLGHREVDQGAQGQESAVDMRQSRQRC